MIAALALLKGKGKLIGLVAIAVIAIGLFFWHLDEVRESYQAGFDSCGDQLTSQANERIKATYERRLAVAAQEAEIQAEIIRSRDQMIGDLRAAELAHRAERDIAVKQMEKALASIPDELWFHLSEPVADDIVSEMRGDDPEGRGEDRQ